MMQGSYHDFALPSKNLADNSIIESIDGKQKERCHRKEPPKLETNKKYAVNGLVKRMELVDDYRSSQIKDKFPASKQDLSSKVRWSVQSLTKSKNADKVPASNLKSWLSPTKKDELRMQGSNSSSSNGSFQSSVNPGFDLAKLYPELSSKLGLIKPLSNNETVVGMKGVESNDLSCGSINTLPELQHRNDKNFSLVKSLDSVPLGENKSNSENHLVVKSNRKLSFNSINKNATPKQREKLDLTKLSEDKMKHLIAYQQRSMSLSSCLYNSPQMHTKNNITKPKLTNVSFFEVMCDKTFPCKFTLNSSPDILSQRTLNFFPRESSSLMPNARNLSQVQLRVQNLYQDEYAYRSNLTPLSYVSLSSVACNDEDVRNHSVVNPKHNFLSSSFEEHSGSKEFNSLRQWQLQSMCTKAEFLNRKAELNGRWALTRALLEAARSDPGTAATTVSKFIKKFTVISNKRKRSKSSSLLLPRHCVYEGDVGLMCGQRALPGTRHCMRHITYNVDQQLFSQCSARKHDNSLCRIPTLHIQNEYPLCLQHSKNADKHNSFSPSSVLAPDESCSSRSSNHQQQQQQQQQQPKRVRKKSKMPALSRGKRNRRKRKISAGGGGCSSTSSVIPSTYVRPPTCNVPSSTAFVGSPSSPSPLTPHTSPSFSTPCSDQASNPTIGDDESEFEDELEGMVSGLPIEARDIQDVLNKIPEDEFSQILYGPEGRLYDAAEDDDRKSNKTGSGAFVSSSSAKTSTTELTPYSIEEGALGELISTSFNQQELNAISQVLSNMVGDGQLDLGSDFHVGDSEGSLNPPLTPPICYSEDSNSVQSPPAPHRPVGDVGESGAASAAGLSPVMAVVGPPSSNTKLKINPAL